MLEIIKPGLYTSVQDYPGRVGYWHVGIPPSGPMDPFAFRIGNKLVGNRDEAAGLEITMGGPTIKFSEDTVIALTGARLVASLDGCKIPWWKPIRVRGGSVLELGFPDSSGGMRAYLAVRGGIDVPVYLGSRSTFPFGEYGGFEGRILQADDKLQVGDLCVEKCGPELDRHFAVIVEDSYPNKWEIGVVEGPHSNPDYFTDDDSTMIYDTWWKVHHNSNRLGYRFEGPNPEFTRSSGGEGGAHPSNILDYTYAIGTINFTGNMPIILTVDGPSLGGFVSFATIATAEQWKIGQAKPGDHVKFVKIDLEQALALKRWQDRMIDNIAPDYLKD